MTFRLTKLIVVLAIVVGVVSVIASLFGIISPGSNSDVVSRGVAGTAFPDVLGINLEGKRVALPDGFEGPLNLVAVAFEQGQQELVNTWIASADRLRDEFRGLRFYEVPTIYEANPMFRFWVNNGMRSGITDTEARRRTITVYVDRDRFTDALDIPDMKDIHLFLLDNNGQVRWRSSGAASEQKLGGLVEVLSQGT